MFSACFYSSDIRFGTSPSISVIFSPILDTAVAGNLLATSRDTRTRTAFMGTVLDQLARRNLFSWTRPEIEVKYIRLKSLLLIAEIEQTRKSGMKRAEKRNGWGALAERVNVFLLEFSVLRLFLDQATNSDKHSCHDPNGCFPAAIFSSVQC